MRREVEREGEREEEREGEEREIVIETERGRMLRER